MRIASISDNDSINSITGFTLSIFTQSCPHHCKGCFSQQTWSDSGGKEYKIDEIKELINNSKCHNISFLGGDPLAPLNRVLRSACKESCDMIHLQVSPQYHPGAW